MDPVTVSVIVSKPRDEVFDYLADIANHPEFTDHFLTRWRLTREDSWGQGAGARFRLDRRNRFQWGELTFVEVAPPHRIVALGRQGKFNRVKTAWIWTLDPAPGGTRVELSVETEPAMLTDKLAELGLRGWMKRRAGKALRRLRLILEENAERGRRATVAGL